MDKNVTVTVEEREGGETVFTYDGVSTHLTTPPLLASRPLARTTLSHSHSLWS